MRLEDLTKVKVLDDTFRLVGKKMCSLQNNRSGKPHFQLAKDPATEKCAEEGANTFELEQFVCSSVEGDEGIGKEN
jgi:hypothetical protein